MRSAVTGAVLDVSAGRWVVERGEGDWGSARQWRMRQRLWGLRRVRGRRRRHPPIVARRLRRDPPVGRGRQKWRGAEDRVGEGARRWGAGGQKARKRGRPLRRCGCVSDSGEGLVTFGRRSPVKMFLVDKDARRGDDLLADEHVVPPF